MVILVQCWAMRSKQVSLAGRGKCPIGTKRDVRIIASVHGTFDRDTRLDLEQHHGAKFTLRRAKLFACLSVAPCCMLRNGKQNMSIYCEIFIHGGNEGTMRTVFDKAFSELKCLKSVRVEDLASAYILISCPLRTLRCEHLRTLIE